MASLAAGRRKDVLITRGAAAAEARAIQRRARAGELVRIAEGIYLEEKTPEAQAAVVRRNWQRIVGTLAPGGVFRTGALTPEESRQTAC